jgi:hypothetical protein
MIMVYLSAIVILSFLVGLFVEDPTAGVRLTHPAIWAGNFMGSLLSLWLSACLLALYHRVESVPVQEEAHRG